MWRLIRIATSTMSQLAGQRSLQRGYRALDRGDYSSALQIWLAAAVQGDDQAQFNAAALYRQGLGVEANAIEAAKWYRRAAEQGHAFAQLLLGRMYLDGEGVAQDNAEAVKWIRMSADQGNAAAQSTMGVMCKDGIGVEQDIAEAGMWFYCAAKQGDIEAQCNLGLILATTAKDSEDQVDAYQWLLLASLHEPHPAQARSAQALRLLEQEMTETQIDRAIDCAQKLAVRLSRELAESQ